MYWSQPKNPLEGQQSMLPIDEFTVTVEGVSIHRDKAGIFWRIQNGNKVPFTDQTLLARLTSQYELEIAQQVDQQARQAQTNKHLLYGGIALKLRVNQQSETIRILERKVFVTCQKPDSILDAEIIG
jgi:hypothetical protein